MIDLLWYYGQNKDKGTSQTIKSTLRISILCYAIRIIAVCYNPVNYKSEIAYFSDQSKAYIVLYSTISRSWPS